MRGAELGAAIAYARMRAELAYGATLPQCNRMRGAELRYGDVHTGVWHLVAGTAIVRGAAGVLYWDS
eukprot:1768054-Rhodomonas_salina.1